MKTLTSGWFRMLTMIVAAGALPVGLSAPSASGSPVVLGSAADYAVLGIGGVTAAQDGIQVYQSDTVINGNVGAGPFDNFTHGMDATINGRLDYDTNDTLPTITGTITGGTHQMSMAGVVADARAADVSAAGLGPTSTVSTLVDEGTLDLAAGLNVIRITGDVTLKKTYTINGSAGSSVVFQLTANDAISDHQLTLTGVQFSLTGGVSADNILWDMTGTGGGIVISSKSVTYGTFLAPDRDILVDAATVNGRVIGGGGTTTESLSIHSGSTINAPLITNVPDGGSTVTLFGLAFTALGALRRKLRSV